MNNIYSLLCCCIIFCMTACGDASNTPTVSEDTTAITQPTSKAVELVVQQNIKIIPQAEADEQGFYWSTPLIIELAEGFSIVSPSADKGSKDWMFEAYTLQKDGQEIYAFPHKEEDMRSTIVSREQEEQQWYPKVLSKANKTAIVMLRYLGEELQRSHVVDVIKIEDGRFVAYLEDVVDYYYIEDLSQETLESIFAKSFE